MGELTIESAPIGTKAPSLIGGHWVRVATGWKWATSRDVFPRPGGYWNGTLIPPIGYSPTTGEDGDE